MKLLAYVDGGYRSIGNLSTIGVVILAESTATEVATRSYRIDGAQLRDATLAEWEAVFAGVLVALSLGATHLTLHSDRKDITERQGQAGKPEKVLRELVKPLVEFRLVRGHIQQAHTLACAGRKEGAELWKPLMDWKSAKTRPSRPVAPWMKIQQQEAARRKAEKHRCYDPATGRLVIHDLRIKFNDEAR